MEPTPVTHDRAAKEGEGQALTREQAIVFAERWFDRKWGNDGQYQSLMETMVTRLLAIAATQPPQELVGLREALEKIRRTPTMPFPDPGAHSWRAFGEAVHRAYVRIQQVAEAALTRQSQPQELAGLREAVLSERERCVRILEFHGHVGMANALREQDPDTTYNEFLDGSK